MSVVVVKNYLTDQEAESVLNFLNRSFSAKTGPERSVQRFGATVSYGSNKVSDAIPPALQYLCDKLEIGGYCSDIKHVTVNRYDPGQTIPFHTDTKKAGDIITIISLASDAVMLFKNDRGVNSRFVIPANSLTQFSDEHRWKMKHSIEPVKETRYSIVFRKQ